MGYLREKYTKEYYLGHRVNDNNQLVPVGYGAMGFDEFLSNKVPAHMLQILTQVNFERKNVLDIGFGRGESLTYATLQGAKRCVGIDFSEQAIVLARQFMKAMKVRPAILVCSDALEMLPYIHSGGEDIVIMFDVIEHLPKEEALMILHHVNRVLNVDGMLLINTPFYGVDEDIIAQKGVYIAPSPTDLIPETKGMHCNKFTEQRFYETLKDCGFTKTENPHIFTKRKGGE